MAVYICEICDNFTDDDEDPGTEYSGGLICSDCLVNMLNEVEAELGEKTISKMSEEEQLEWASKNL